MIAPRRLLLTIAGIEIRAELFDTPTARALYDAAPFESRAHTWGEEVWFDTPVSPRREADARAVVTAGETRLLGRGLSDRHRFRSDADQSRR